MIVSITNQIRAEIESILTDVSVLGAFPDVEPVFPSVVVNELSNDIDEDTVDSSGETHNSVVLELNIYTYGEGKQSQALTIRNTVDALLSGQYRMRRVFSSETPNFADTRVYRYTMRYAFKINENKKIYRR